MRYLEKKFDDRTHVIPLFKEQMVIAVNRAHRLANQVGFPVKEMDGERYIHRVNCEFAGYADHILQEKGVTCTPSYWSERDDWTLAMVAAGLGFAFMPKKCDQTPRCDRSPNRGSGVLARGQSCDRQGSSLFTRRRRAGPGSDAKKWFGQYAIAARSAKEKYRHGATRRNTLR